MGMSGEATAGGRGQEGSGFCVVLGDGSNGMALLWCAEGKGGPCVLLVCVGGEGDGMAFDDDC